MEICLIVVATQDYSWLVRTTDNINTGKISFVLPVKKSLLQVATSKGLSLSAQS